MPIKITRSKPTGVTGITEIGPKRFRARVWWTDSRTGRRRKAEKVLGSLEEAVVVAVERVDQRIVRSGGIGRDNGDRRAPALELHVVEKLAHVPDRQARDLRQRVIVDENMPRGPVEARAFALGAGTAVEELRKFLADSARFRFAVAAFEIGQNALEAMRLAHLHTARVLVEEVDLLVAEVDLPLQDLGASHQHRVPFTGNRINGRI